MTYQQIKAFLADQKKLRAEASKGGEAKYSEPCGIAADKIKAAMISNIDESVKFDPTIPYHWVENEKGHIVAIFGCGPTSANNMDFFIQAANNYTNIIGCLEIAIDGLYKVAEDDGRKSDLVKALSEITVKLGKSHG